MLQESEELANYFHPFRLETTGHDVTISTPFGTKPLIYTDWTASGRAFRPIQELLSGPIGAMIGNTHTHATATGMAMTQAYHDAKAYIKECVGAGPHDIFTTAGSGMTGAIAKLQRMLQLNVPAWALERLNLANSERPVVFVSHLEHHSNYLSWLATIATVKIVPSEFGLPSLSALEELLRRYADRPLKIGSFSACSNVTGITTPIHAMAALMHKHGGICVADYAASAPYVSINMHPDDPLEALDAIVFSPHKMLGGPGTPGVLIVNAKLLPSPHPDIHGGGTVHWVNPWGQFSLVSNREELEDAGTPPFLGVMQIAEAFVVKAEMGIERIAARKHELLSALFAELDTVSGLKILESDKRDRQAIVSFTTEHLHYGLVVKLLNDCFGIQSRGGCSCAGPYGHTLFGISREQSATICTAIDHGDNSLKPGWTRVSLHPTNTLDEVRQVGHALREIAKKGAEWGRAYKYDPATNEFAYVG